MKGIMQSMKRRFSSDRKTGRDGKEIRPHRSGMQHERSASNSSVGSVSSGGGSGDWKVDSGSYIINKDLPRHRRDRKVTTAVLQQLPSLHEIPASEFESLVIRKLRLCSYVFDFTDMNQTMLQEKEMKRLCLLELTDYLTKGKLGLNETILQEIIEMISCNLFRPLPPSSAEIGLYDPEEDEPVLECSWPHLQIVYEFLLRLIQSTETDPKLLKKYINASFVLKILQPFDSEDPREREYLKTVLHRIYGKFMSLRAFVRKSINNIFFKFMYDDERHNGIAELLEILGSIINGFALPLKPEHKQFLKRVLIPLHSPKPLALYHPQLSYCTTQFIEKDPILGVEIINGLLRYWPKCSSKKEVMFLNELEEILERIDQPQLEQVQTPLFKQLARSVNSPHFQVAERAIYLLNNEILLNYISAGRTVIVPILFGPLYQNSKNHWNPTVNDLTLNILKMLMEMDVELFDKCSEIHEKEMVDLSAKNDQRQKDWDNLLERTKDERKAFDQEALREKRRKKAKQQEEKA